MLRAQYLAVSEKAKAAADLVLDGAQPPAAVARSLADALAGQGLRD